MNDEHKSPYVIITNNIVEKQCHNCSHFDLVNAYFILKNFT
jgi:hypothetical protein